jgi:hypothetical protein
MTDRLKKIEWRHADVLAEWDTEWGTDDYTTLITDDIPWLVARVRELEAQEMLDSQIDRLANVIMYEIPGEPSQNEGACDTAIRIMRTQKARIRELEAQAALAEAVLARRAMEKALEDWLDSEQPDAGGKTYALLSREVRNARALEDAALDAALAARGE